MFRLKSLLTVLSVIVMLAAFTSASRAQAQMTCLNAWTTHLQIGDYGRVNPGIPNILRSRPYIGYDSAVITEIPALSTFSVIGGPSCYNNMTMWQVNYNGQIGWIPEAADWGYWIEPYNPNNCMAVASRLSAGQYARVLPGLPNVLRSQPDRSANSVVLATLPVGMVFSVNGSPSCSEGMIWWQVNTLGQIGWTAEGQYSTYWLEPYGPTLPVPSTCATTGNPPVVIGYTGIVAPGIPNNLRAQASLNAPILASMNAGETFMVLSSPVCDNGLNWWQVNYRGRVGWTVEGQNGQSWISLLSCPGFMASRISVGKYARVTPGLPNRLRSSASTGSLSLALIPAGATFSVIGGAVCAENATWWQVNYQGIIGWTMEGQSNQYWLEAAN